MIEYLKGKVVDIGPNYAVMELSNIALKINLSTDDIGKLRPGSNSLIYTFLSIKDSGAELYGFLSKEARQIFELLLLVSGVGVKHALSILSAFKPNQIKKAIFEEDYTLLATVPKIGKKTAKKIIVELKDRIKCYEAIESLQAEIESRVVKDAVMALEALGYSKSEAESAVRSNLQEIPGNATVSDILKIALNTLRK